MRVPALRPPPSVRPHAITVPSLDPDSPSPPLHAPAGAVPPLSLRAPLLFVCTDCWRTFSDGSRAACECEKPRPAQGWAAMPHLFRGRYLFVELLGRGGMGAVFRAYDQAAHESPWVAVKVVQQARPELAAMLKDMFQKEVAAAQMLAQHKQFFVQVLGHDGVDPAYLVSEHVPWQTLEQLLSSLPGSVEWLPPTQVARIGIAVLRGVAKMHFHRIVHRDLTPANIFIQRATDQEGAGYDVKITDLGIWAFDQVQGDSESLTLANRRPTIDGTPAYMSPEQSTGEPVGAASDIHTIGSVLWELATGEVPFPARGDVPAFQAVEKRVELLKRAPQRPGGMPEGLYNVLVKALAFDPKKRWASATEMRRALEAFFNHYSQQRQRDLEGSFKAIDKMSEQVANLREKLLPMRGLLERLGHLGAVLREVREHREEAEPDALRGIAENAKKQLEEIRSELNALAAWLEFVAGQTGKTSIRSPATRTEPSMGMKPRAEVDRAEPARTAPHARPEENEPPSSALLLERQPWIERSPWVTIAIAAGIALAVGLGYMLGRPRSGSTDSTDEPQAAAPASTTRIETPRQTAVNPSDVAPAAPEAAPPVVAPSLSAVATQPAAPPPARPPLVSEPPPKTALAPTSTATKPPSGPTKSTNPYLAAPTATATAKEPASSGARDLIRKNPYE